jgi:hypothetical protein
VRQRRQLRQLTLPLRIAARSLVGFVKVIAPAKVVRDRVLIGWRYRRVRRHHRLERVSKSRGEPTSALSARNSSTCPSTTSSTSSTAPDPPPTRPARATVFDGA